MAAKIRPRTCGPCPASRTQTGRSTAFAAWSSRFMTPSTLTTVSRTGSRPRNVSPATSSAR
ncbi:hypothetical protein AFB00_02275 [Pseudonocardia sp. HH130630-07]|nr:hypothetical protein AFB00_02275 [Pseudonocardia sp. HH130630-07]